MKEDFMGTIATDNGKVILYYNSENSLGQQAYAYVNASDRGILAIDISKTKVTGTQWAEIAANLNTNLSGLVNQEHPDFKNNYKTEDASLSNDDWIKVLQNHPSSLRCPILIDGKTFHFIETPSEISKYFDKEEASDDARSQDKS
ncbi:Arsenate reductase, glutaredoxin family [Bizionia echini]|uniref:Arsenate reductase, glutaredoxin family n=1 Tax=Bizionia echini TaxID=649333 RepID=A0A1I5BIC7_9FLAO|nr:ArsC/Spx/MgsR family protein [Bizionia echini]SFN74241.1 Arsenate reductase, glutaredoxin family [Bizionia echini]